MRNAIGGQTSQTSLTSDILHTGPNLQPSGGLLCEEDQMLWNTVRDPWADVLLAESGGISEGTWSAPISEQLRWFLSVCHRLAWLSVVRAMLLSWLVYISTDHNSSCMVILFIDNV